METARENIVVSGGRYSAGSGTRFPLLPPCQLSTENGRVNLSGRYQRPGAGWRALLATGITFVIVVIVAQAVGFAAGPGYLIWYYIFSRMRRADIELDLASAQEAVADDRKQRLAFRIPIEGKPAWIGFGAKSDYPRILSMLRGVPGLNIRSGDVKKSMPMLWLWIIIIICITGIVAAIAIPSLIQARRRAEVLTTQAQMRSIFIAISDYQVDNAALPEKLEDLMPGYLKAIPMDAWRRNLVYQKSGETFTLKSLGMDGIESGDDIIFQER